jgi:1-phosphatidylinositol phosphodiesterase
MLTTLKSRLKVCLILIFSLTQVSQAHEHHSYSHDGGRRANNPNWMSILEDSVLLSELSIPGTHESLSFFGGSLVKTQSMALRFQLESGIRVLDVRCAIVGNSFNIYHGNIYQEENFDGVLKTVVDFLKDHPRETILMRVKQEKTDLPGKFEEIFRDTYWNNKAYKDYMWRGQVLNPTLGEMRGKIVVLQDFARWQCPTPEYPSDPVSSIHPQYGICYNSFDIQDEFKVPGLEALYTKWLFVKAHLDLANTGFDTGRNKETKFMNYLSGVGIPLSLGFPHPYFVASGHINPATKSPRKWTGQLDIGNRWRDFPRFNGSIYYEGTNTLTYGAIRTGYYTKRVGIIMTDFPGGGLIERIICINYKKPEPMCKKLPPCTGRMCGRT